MNQLMLFRVLRMTLVFIYAFIICPYVCIVLNLCSVFVWRINLYRPNNLRLFWYICKVMSSVTVDCDRLILYGILDYTYLWYLPEKYQVLHCMLSVTYSCTPYLNAFYLILCIKQISTSPKGLITGPCPLGKSS